MLRLGLWEKRSFWSQYWKTDKHLQGRGLFLVRERYLLKMTWAPFPEKYTPLCVCPSKQGPAPVFVVGLDISAPFILKLRKHPETLCFGRSLDCEFKVNKFIKRITKVSLKKNPSLYTSCHFLPLTPCERTLGHCPKTQVT